MRRDSFRWFATRIVQRVSVPNWIGITRGGVRWRAGADANPDGVWRLHAARRNWSWRTRRGLSGTPEKPQSDCRVESHWSRPMVEHAALETLPARSRGGGETRACANCSDLRDRRTRRFVLLQHEVRRRRPTG